MKRLTIVAAALALAGCVTGPEQLASQTPPTAAMKRNIANAARDVVRDPYSIRDAEISSVMPVTGGSYVCVKANSKNGFGGYVGRSGYTVFLKGDVPVKVTANDAWCQNPNIRYYPFRELEALKDI